MAKQKGNKAELEVARLLEPWWQQLEPEALFVRTPRSGGWTQGRDLFDARGDLMCKNAPKFPWCVEVKRRERWALENLELGNPCPVWGWWAQACEDATEAKRLPMLWVRQNRRPWLVLLPLPMKVRAPHPDMPFTHAMRCFSDCPWAPVAYWEDKLLASHPSRWV